MYKYSIIIPVYNSENTIKRAIDSVLSQTYLNWELIIVDDGSTDNSLKIVNEYHDDRIRILCQSNSGPGKARNFGIENAIGDYVVFLDSDDYYDNDYLESIDIVNKESKKQVVFIDFVNEYENGEIIEKSNIYYYRKDNKFELISKQMTGKIPWGSFVKAVSIDIAKKCQFNEIDVGEEVVYSFDVLEKSTDIGFVKDPKYHYIFNNNGQHKKGGLDPWRYAVEAIEKHLSNKGLINKYEKSVNSLAIKALCISVYRCAI